MGDYQEGIGNAYLTIPNGERSSNLKMALQAYEEEQCVHSRNKYTNEWSAAEFNRGTVLYSLADEGEQEDYAKSILAYTNALAVLSPAERSDLVLRAKTQLGYI